MRLVTYESDGATAVGILDGEVVLDVDFDGNMIEFLEAGMPVGTTAPVPDAVLRAPLRPRSLRDFLAFEGHLNNALSRLGRDIPQEWYDTPAYYKGMPDTVIGPEDEIPWPRYAEQLDHELELAVVIGTPGRNIDAETALDHVAGVTIWNDVSARDTQRRELPVGMGPSKAKDWDGSNVLGPCIVTLDEIDLADLHASVRVNGETWGQDTTANMHHRFSDMIAYASMDQTLHVGEVIGSGTFAGGSGLELDRWLQPGDVVEMEAHGIGVLRNSIGPRP